MFKNVFSVFAMCAAAGMLAQDIVLPPAEESGGAALRDALRERRTIRAFSGAELTKQELSNLLFATAGINRPEESRLTIPTARNAQDLILYVVLPNGLYRYNPKDHSLQLKVKGDKRELVGKQKEMFRKASAVLIFVSDSAKLGFSPDAEQRTVYAAFHAGCASQNASLFCAAAGLGSVVIGSFDREESEKLLNLGKNYPVMMMQLVGVPAK